MPSQFMRQLRPELYSDTEERTDYRLDAPMLEYHLETLTRRNQTHDFEIFCRKLCERAICPNLRAQTGPDGGGDSKADSETFPVADEVGELFYEGEANAGNQRWGFAFSAKEDWKQKVKDDVQGLLDTGRSYDRIICVTSRFAKSKDRAKLEDDLSEHAGVPVTIHDRTWIVDQVIENQRKDLAFNYLGVGAEVSEGSKLGPDDYSRLRQLEKIETELADPTAYRGIEQDRVVDGLLAAKLARGLEKPRTEIDGRFARAIRLADKYGNLHQRIEARYEHVWTALWWFDDFDFLEAEYPVIEALCDQASHTRTLQFLLNLIQLFVNGIIYGHLDRSACRFDQRIGILSSWLEAMAADKDRPNNQLEAEAALQHIAMSLAILSNDTDALSRIWETYSTILDRAQGLGEFDALRLARLIEVAEVAAGDDSAYAALIDKLAAFVTDRTGEAQGALILLRRAEKLGFSRHFEMIRLLSKAATQLSKREHTSELVDALCSLTLAYRSAGLLWAARATCIFAISTMIVDTEAGERPPPRLVVMAKVWGWISLDLNHLPDFVAAIGLLRGTTEVLPFATEDREKLRRDATSLELACGSRILNLSNGELPKLAEWPDLFEATRLFVPRTALLFTLGYEDVLRADESIPASESESDVKDLLSRLANQAVGDTSSGIGVVLNGKNASQTLSTKLLGMRVDIQTLGSQNAILAGETVVSSLEAFFATTIEHRVFPHTEHFAICVVEDKAATAPFFAISRDEMTGTLTWPTDLAPTSYGNREIIRDVWVDVAAQVIAVTCFIPDAELVLQALTRGERVLGRMMLVAASPNSYHRMFNRYLTRAGDLFEGELRDYPPRSPRPEVDKFDLKGLAQRPSDCEDAASDRREIAAESHRDHTIRSVIDVHLWDKAAWRGAGFVEHEPGYPPLLALLFEDEEAATKIFERWRGRFTHYDEGDRIRVSIIRNLADRPPAHYALQISANAYPSEVEPGQIVGLIARCLTAEPASSVNLDRFLLQYSRYRAYYLAPAIIQPGLGQPRFLDNIRIIKRELNIVDAASVTEQMIEWLAVKQSAID